MKNRKHARKKREQTTRRDAQGRLHLLLQRDALGVVHLSLRAPLFQEEWQNRLTLHSVQRALSAWGIEPTVEATVRVAHDATAQHEDVVRQFFQQDASARVACKAGCDHCCHQSVGVTPVEALGVLQYLSEHLSASEIQALAQRTQAARVRTHGLSADDRYSPDHPCVFLQSGSCSIYPARPLSCRGANSLDAEECRRSLREPAARREFLDGDGSAGGRGQTYLEPIRAFHAISAGLQLALSEVHHLDMRPLDLIAAMDLLLGPNAKALVSDWFAGKPAFASAYGAERDLL